MVDDDKATPVENATATESVSSTEDNQESQVSEPVDGFEQAFNGGSNESNQELDGDNADKSESDDSEQVKDGQPETNDGKPTKGAEKRKEQLNTEIDQAQTEIRELVARKNDLLAQKNAIKEETTRLMQEQYRQESQNLTEDELINQINPDTGDYYTRAEAKALVLENKLNRIEQQRQQDEYMSKVSETRFQIDQEASQVIKDFPIFDPESDQYDKEIATGAAEILSQAIDIDPNTGMEIGCRIPIHKFYSLLAKCTETAKKQGEISGREAATRMMGSVDIPSNNSSTKTKEVDDFTEAFLSGD